MATVLETDVLVFGDEVESVLTAVSAARTGVKVRLVRRSMGFLGGLSTRGGLAYMDITPACKSPIFKEFTEGAGVKHVALEPQRAHDVLEALLVEAGVTVHSGATYNARYENNRWLTSPYLQTGETISAQVLIDATPDADVARWMQVPFIRGLGGLLGPGFEFLGVSPVFKLHNVGVEELRAFEAGLRAKPKTRDILESALPFHTEAQKNDFVTRPTYAPPDGDYLDILNPVIGVYYHLWRHNNDPSSYTQAFASIDGANIALLPDANTGKQVLAFNGLVFQMGYRFSDEACFEALLAYSHGAALPEYMQSEMRAFERFLKEEAGFSRAKVVPPEDLYVRQLLTMLAQKNLTAEDMIRGGVAPEKAIGTSSYWLDFRGIDLRRNYPELNLPKPVFNVGLEQTLPLLSEPTPKLENLAFVSRSAGYSPLGQGAGRIVQNNVMVGEALGIAAALCVLGKTTLGDVIENGIGQVRDALTHRNGGAIKLEGQQLWTDALIKESALLADDNAVVEAHRNELMLV